jgi:hypothetical protein
VTRRLLLLIGIVAAMWLLLGLPARHLGGGDDALVYAGVAALLCAVPMAASIVVLARVAVRRPQLLPIATLGAGGGRMFFVLFGGVALASAGPFFRQTAFWLWLVVFYLATLTLDVVLLLKSQPPGSVK